jgi:hypothetical protein
VPPGDRLLISHGAADAERSRLKILDAAGSVFADSGLDASLEEIADRAGVGIATRYLPEGGHRRLTPFPCY